MRRSDAGLRTRVCERLGIEHPVLQAGMGWIAHGRLAAAVSRAGGLGVIGAGSSMSADELRHEIAVVRSLTDRPFGVDILFAKIGEPGELGVAGGRGGAASSTRSTASVSAGVTGAATLATVERYTATVEALVEVVLEERVPVLISGLGSPAAVVPEAHARGIQVMSVVGSVRHAEKAVADGVDMVIASGSEGGGHVGNIGTMALVPAVVDAVDVPVIAGGGIADGRGLLAALALGAQGIWMGTRFVATPESISHANYKQRIVETSVAGTTVTRAHSGKPCRLIANQFTADWQGREHAIKPFPLQILEVGHAASDLGRLQGDVEHGVLPAGQSAGLIGSVVPAGEVVAQVMREAREALARISATTD